ncbi:MAG: hypothetical protein NT178_08340 [Proteobacteria bacterium]|nr:hypothetical protein [Pseudomonadota bacterium]
MMKKRIVGIDFSGARNAGKKIWISIGATDGKKCFVTKCFRAADLPASSRSRDICLRALVEWIENQNALAVGFDFPFGIPINLMRQHSWEHFLSNFPSNFKTPEDFKQHCKDGASDREIKRQTDREAETPFSPYNLWLYRQTYYGIRDVLHPLVAHKSVCVLPMQAPMPDKTWVMEICPASTLQREGLYRRPYKGKGAEKRNARLRIVEELTARGLLEISSKQVLDSILVDTEGDALDSLISALAVSKALSRVDFEIEAKDPIYLKEGYVY